MNGLQDWPAEAGWTSPALVLGGLVVVYCGELSSLARTERLGACSVPERPLPAAVAPQVMINLKP